LHTDFDLKGMQKRYLVSPVLYCIYIDELVDHLKTSQVGCYILGMFMGVIIYADDIALLAPSRSALQKMVNVAAKYGTEMDIRFNPLKSQAMIVGRSHGSDLAPLTLNGKSIGFVKQFKYLGLTIMSHKKFQCDVSEKVSKYYDSLNSLLRFRTKPSELVQLHLLTTHCAPILTYGIEVLRCSSQSCQSMKVAYNALFRRVIGFRRNEFSISEVARGFGFDNWDDLCLKRQQRFLLRKLNSSNRIIRVLLTVM